MLQRLQTLPDTAVYCTGNDCQVTLYFNVKTSLHSIRKITQFRLCTISNYQLSIQNVSFLLSDILDKIAKVHTIPLDECQSTNLVSNWVFEEWGMGMIENEILFSAEILPGVMMKSIPDEGMKVCCHCDACIESPGLESPHRTQTFRWLKLKFQRALIKSHYVMDFFFLMIKLKIQHDLIISVLHYEALLVHRAS